MLIFIHLVKIKILKDTADNLGWFLTLATESPDKCICESKPRLNYV